MILVVVCGVILAGLMVLVVYGAWQSSKYDDLSGDWDRWSPWKREAFKRDFGGKRHEDVAARRGQE